LEAKSSKKNRLSKKFSIRGFFSKMMLKIGWSLSATYKTAGLKHFKTPAVHAAKEPEI
jgi:hypothetical protein